MPQFEFSRWDGSQEFTPQSADKLFDQFSNYMLDYGSNMLDYLEEWAEDHPEIVEMLMKRGHVDKDEQGKYFITPQGVKRVESRALEELFNITRKGGSGNHETDFRGPGQTVHSESKPYEFGDPVSNVDMHATLKNALARQGGGSPISVSEDDLICLLYTSPSPRDVEESRMPSSA